MRYLKNRFLLMVALGLILGSACAQTERPVSGLSNPFSARIESEDGLVVKWNGFSDGYEPGGSATVDIGIENGTGEPIELRYCVQLLNERDLVTSLTQRDVTLQPAGAFGTSMVLNLPQDLRAGAYGLVLVVRRPAGPLVNTVTIKVGDTTATYAPEPSANDAALAACLPLPRTESIEIPEADVRLTLPLHILAHVGQPGQQVTAVLNWQDGTELSGPFPILEAPDGRGLLIGSLDWMTEGPPPQPPTQLATLTLRGPSDTVLAQQEIIVVSPNDPDTVLVDLYWLLGENLQAAQSRIPQVGDATASTLRELLWGPSPNDLAGFTTAIPTPEEVLTYPGQGADWGVRVRLLDLTIENGVATANFSKEMRAYGGGSARVQSIREQITRTLLQFSTIREVRIAIEGQTQSVLQP
jgi:hypothetical protein